MKSDLFMVGLLLCQVNGWIEKPLFLAAGDGSRACQLGLWPVLFNEIPGRDVERVAGSRGAPHHALAPADAKKRERAVVAVGVVPGASHDGVRRPRTTAEAVGGVIAGTAVPPEVLDRTLAHEAHPRRAFPDVLESIFADVAANVIGRRKRRASFDIAVGLDADGSAACAAGAPVALGKRIPKLRLVRAEVADVVARPEDTARLVTSPLQPGEHRDQLEHLVRLQNKGGPIRG